MTPGNWGFPGGSAGKDSPCNGGDLDLIPGLGGSHGEGNSYPLQYSGLENSMDLFHGITKSWTRLSDFHFHFHFQGIDVFFFFFCLVILFFFANSLFLWFFFPPGKTWSTLIPDFQFFVLLTGASFRMFSFSSVKSLVCSRCSTHIGWNIGLPRMVRTMQKHLMFSVLNGSSFESHQPY